MKIKTSTLDIMKQTRNTWERNPVTRIHDHDPRRNRKKERQNVKQFLRKAQSQDDGAFCILYKTFIRRDLQDLDFVVNPTSPLNPVKIVPIALLELFTLSPEWHRIINYLRN